MRVLSLFAPDKLINNNFAEICCKACRMVPSLLSRLTPLGERACTRKSIQKVKNILLLMAGDMIFLLLDFRKPLGQEVRCVDI